MLDVGQWKDYIEVAGVLFSMGMAIIAILRSSKAKQNDDTNKKFDELSKILQDHVKEDSEVQTKLQIDVAEVKTDVKNATKIIDKLDEKMDKIVEKL